MSMVIMEIIDNMKDHKFNFREKIGTIRKKWKCWKSIQ